MNLATRYFLVALFIVALAGCKKRIDDPAPMENGSYLTYRIQETSPGGSEIYDLTFRFQKSEDVLTATVDAPGGGTTIKMDLEAVPEGREIPLQLKTAKVDLALLWLPPNSRKNGVVSPAGRVTKQQPYKTWASVWEVIDGRTTPTTRYYESNLGVLVGFTIARGSDQIGGYLVDSQ